MSNLWGTVLGKDWMFQSHFGGGRARSWSQTAPVPAMATAILTLFPQGGDHHTLSSPYPTPFFCSAQSLPKRGHLASCRLSGPGPQKKNSTHSLQLELQESTYTQLKFITPKNSLPGEHLHGRVSALCSRAVPPPEGTSSSRCDR